MCIKSEMTQFSLINKSLGVVMTLLIIAQTAKIKNFLCKTNKKVERKLWKRYIKEMVLLSLRIKIKSKLRGVKDHMDSRFFMIFHEKI